MAKAKGKQTTPAANALSPTEPSKDKKEILESISKILVFVAALTGILSAAGFYVVHSYLLKVTQMFTYKLDAIVYVAAGINAILGTIGRFISNSVAGLTNIPLVLISILIWIAIYFIFYKRSEKEGGNFISKRRIYITLLGMLLFLVTAQGLIYGWDGYGYSPRLLGGGEPADVILIFNQPDKISTLGMPLQINPTYSAQSQPVELLMELSDGVLVRDPQTQIPVIIKNELLYGMIDAAPPTPVPTATPQP